jgi:opacity protein-like surface antigen
MRRIALFVGSVIVLVAMAEPALAQWRWGIGLNGGYETGGKLYRVKSDQAAPRWPRPDGSGTVDGTELRAEIDGFASFGVRATLEHPRGLGAILSASISDLDVSVIRRTLAENVDKVPWDQWFTIQVQAVGTWTLLREGNSPYLLAGLGLTSFDSEGDALDQSALGLVVGAGYRVRLNRMWMLDLEFRDTFVALDLDEEAARLSDISSSFEEEGRAQVVELSATLSLMF